MIVTLDFYRIKKTYLSWIFYRIFFFFLQKLQKSSSSFCAQQVRERPNNQVMDSPDKQHRRHMAAEFIHSAATSISSIIPLFPPKKPSRVCLPLRFSVSDDVSPLESTVKSTSSTSSSSSSGLNSTVRISSLSSDGKRGGPAFVGQVFSMCDLTGTGLMAVSTHFDIPFISKRFFTLFLPYFSLEFQFRFRILWVRFHELSPILLGSLE